MEVKERIGWKAKWRIDRFKDPMGEISKALQLGMSMEEAIRKYGQQYLYSSEFESNVALNEGLQKLIELACGISTPTKWDSAKARLGVGNGVTAEDPAQTGLVGGSKTYKAMDGTYPQRSGQTAEWRSTFASGDANYAWEEYTVVNAADDAGDNLNRKISSKGTKSSGESWTLSLKITFS
jgi:hypothetical protein